MSKIAIIGDLHFGVRQGDIRFYDFQMNWLKGTVKKIAKLGIKNIIQVGDFFDVRKHTDNRILHNIINEFKSGELGYAYNIDWDILVGNHDIYLRDSNEFYSTAILPLLSQDYDISVHNHITETEFGLFIPWLDEYNRSQLDKEIARSNSKYAFGHLELAGFPYHQGNMAEHGMNLETFKKFDKVLTGHYHTISNRQNIHYLGSPYHLTFADVPDGDNRGFWVLDTDTGELELIKNEPDQTLFKIFEYDDAKDNDYANPEFYKQFDNKLIKLIVKNIEDQKLFKVFKKNIHSCNYIDLKVIDETIKDKIEQVSIDEATLATHTMQVFNSYIDKQSNITHKEAIKLLANEVYLEVQQND